MISRNEKSTESNYRDPSLFQEVKRKYLIRSVTDPITQSEISIKDAIDKGIVIMERGIYANPESGAYLTIPEAMQRDLIKVSLLTY